MFCLYKYCIVFKGASYSFEMLLQNKPFGVHEQFIADKVKVKYISIITDQTLENTKKICETVGGLCQLQRMALLVMYDVLPTTK